MRLTLFTRLFLLLTSLLFLSACSGGQAAASWPGLTTDGNVAYLAFNQFVYAIELDTGQQIWRFPAEKAESNLVFYAPPVLISENELLVGSFAQNGAKPRLFNLDAATGQQNWVFEGASNHFVASPLVANDAIYAVNADGNVYALNMNGTERWKFKTERSIWASPTTNEACDCIFVASMDHSLYALDAQTGAQRWKSPDLGGALASAPAYYDGVLFQGTSDKQMLAIDAATGKTIWAFNAAGWIWSGAAFQDGILYFGDLEGNLYAVDAQTGKQVWTVKADGAILSKPLIQNGKIYYSTETTHIYAVDMDGKPQWQQETTAKVYAPVLAAGDLILVSQTDVNSPLVAYSLEGSLKWSFNLEK